MPQAGAPVGNLHQATYLRAERLPAGVGEVLFLNGEADSCFFMFDKLLSNASPCSFEVSRPC